MAEHPERLTGLLLGVDPGRSKCGFAFASPEGELLFSGILPLEGPDVPSSLLKALDARDPGSLAPCRREGAPERARGEVARILLGSGTGSGAWRVLPPPWGKRLVWVDERGTTLEARVLFRRLHPPRGIARLIPEGLWCPPRDLDDLAAWAILLRYLREEAGADDFGGFQGASAPSPSRLRGIE